MSQFRHISSPGSAMHADALSAVRLFLEPKKLDRPTASFELLLLGLAVDAERCDRSEEQSSIANGDAACIAGAIDPLHDPVLCVPYLVEHPAFSVRQPERKLSVRLGYSDI